MEEVFEKIKKLRISRNWTLKELSQKTELSSAFLSMIERGSSSLTITSLKKIADAFEVDISYFFQKPLINKTYHVEESEQLSFQIQNSQTTYIRLNGNFPNRLFEPLIVILKPNQQKDENFVHKGEEFYYILKGEVNFIVDHDKFTVKANESIHFPSNIPHDYENPLQEESVMLCVLTPSIF